MKWCKTCHPSVIVPFTHILFLDGFFFFFVHVYIVANLKALNKLDGLEVSLRNSNHQAAHVGTTVRLSKNLQPENLSLLDINFYGRLSSAWGGLEKENMLVPS